MSIVEYLYKNDLNIELRNSIILNNISANIYKYGTNPDCEQYFLANTKYIGYIENNIFKVVNLYDEEPFEDYLIKSLDFIDETTIHILTRIHRDKITITSKLRKIFNFKYMPTFPPRCAENIINLDNAKDNINELNNILKCINFKISIDYIFQMESGVELDTFNLNSTMLLLCLFDRNKCVSSIVIEIDKDERELEISSKTNMHYEGKKLNKLLRAAIIIISKSLYPDADYLVSNAVNPISAYQMIKTFKGKVFNTNENIFLEGVDDIITNEQIKEYMENNDDKITIKVDINNEENIENARNVFNTLSNTEIDCEKISNDETNINTGGKQFFSRKNKRKTTTKRKRKTKTTKRKTTK